MKAQDVTSTNRKKVWIWRNNELAFSSTYDKSSILPLTNVEVVIPFSFSELMHKPKE